MYIAHPRFTTILAALAVLAASKNGYQQCLSDLIENQKPATENGVKAPRSVCRR
jgi:hypothetical protein